MRQGFQRLSDVQARQALENYSYTTTLIAAIRESPTVRRLCGWESLSDIPHESQFSRTFRDFAQDDVGSKALAACLAENLGRNGIMHGCHDSSEIVAREKGVVRKTYFPSFSDFSRMFYPFKPH